MLVTTGSPNGCVVGEKKRNGVFRESVKPRMESPEDASSGPIYIFPLKKIAHFLPLLKVRTTCSEHFRRRKKTLKTGITQANALSLASDDNHYFPSKSGRDKISPRTAAEAFTNKRPSVHSAVIQRCPHGCTIDALRQTRCAHMYRHSPTQYFFAALMARQLHVLVRNT